MVNDPPSHIEPLLTANVGEANTVTVLTTVLLLKQPTELLPVIEYEVVVVGLTVKLLPVIL